MGEGKEEKPVVESVLEALLNGLMARAEIDATVKMGDTTLTFKRTPVAPLPPGGIMSCKGCGRSLEAIDNFCRNCGMAR